MRPMNLTDLVVVGATLYTVVEVTADGYVLAHTMTGRRYLSEGYGSRTLMPVIATEKTNDVGIHPGRFGRADCGRADLAAPSTTAAAA